MSLYLKVRNFTYKVRNSRDVVMVIIIISLSLRSKHVTP